MTRVVIVLVIVFLGMAYEIYRQHKLVRMYRAALFDPAHFPKPQLGRIVMDDMECSCADIQYKDVTRHFRGCPLRAKFPTHKAEESP